ncbi:ABC transporter substrate-binding protein [Mesorhizobium sp. M1D.F.Ca.ET.043.01.1.1]|uniref:ABC transporter substrate-binding protein n=1 Tax=Mesorhizobium sp. M1D.F.Ca.ET.043.01.1.1 TaxID=2493669 RepID=UPI000F74FC68|nr:ABC transporter substrate-binding protein [Mesorhizobium sp. M1D.F.Ca.ET.043.01.1.1]AZO75988.1 sugar ABC transporter substrate-binding protein [Mesorhizobium sp. M1D.F.Ca.ET.043.01.1.1]
MKTLLQLALAASIGIAFALPAIAAERGPVPEGQKAAYERVDPQLPIGPSPLVNFKPKKGPPWKIGYASNYAGNGWRAAIMDEFTNKLLPKYKAAGLVSDFVVTQSELKDTVQIQQMRQMVDDGVDAIIICCSNVTALNQTIEYAHDKGVPVISFSGYVTSPLAINATENAVQNGYIAGEWLAKEMGGKGNILLVSGIPGMATSDSFDLGAKEALADHPDVKIVGNVAGNWTDQVAQVEVQKFLATNPQQIDGILAQSSNENGVLNAVRQSGREMMPIVLGGEASAACFWRNTPDFISKSFHFWPPRADARLAWEVTLRVLEGQGPKNQSILRQALPYTIEDVNAALPKDCDPNSTDWIEPKGDDWATSGVLDAFFERPHDPLSWKP